MIKQSFSIRNQGTHRIGRLWTIAQTVPPHVITNDTQTGGQQGHNLIPQPHIRAQ